jgi:glycine cleavage system aminomethyltransferase T
MKAALLPDRGVVKVAGADARTFLNGLLTTDVTKVTPEQARFGALLTPQGKIIVDCIVAAGAGGALRVGAGASVLLIATFSMQRRTDIDRRARNDLVSYVCRKSMRLVWRAILRRCPITRGNSSR